MAAIFQFALAFSLLKPNPDHPGPLVADRSGELPQTSASSPAAAGTLTPASGGAAGALPSAAESPPSGQLQLASLDSAWIQPGSEARRNVLPIDGRLADAAEGQQGAALRKEIGNNFPEEDQWVAVGGGGEFAHNDAASPPPKAHTQEGSYAGDSLAEQRGQHGDGGAESPDELANTMSATSSSGQRARQKSNFPSCRRKQSKRNHRCLRIGHIRLSISLFTERMVLCCAVRYCRI